MENNEMNKPVDLKAIAEAAVNNTETKVEEVEAEVVEETTVEPAVVDDDIVLGIPVHREEATKDTMDGINTTANLAPGFTPVKPNIDNSLLNEESPKDINDAKYFNNLPPEKQIEYSEYKRSLIVEGLSPQEANIAMINKIKKDFNIADDSSDNIATLQNEAKSLLNEENGVNPSVAVIHIDKTANPDDLGLTEEEHEKLMGSTKGIKLILVEDAEIKTVKIDKDYDPNFKADYIRGIEGSLSKYTVPLPVYGDFVTFKGAQLLQLMTIYSNEDDTLDERVEKKAMLLYDRLIGGRVLKKYSPNKYKPDLSFEDFCNKFPFYDMDMAMYGVLVASSMEDNEIELPCENPKCGKDVRVVYNVKKLLKLDGINDEYKERFDEILGNRGKPDYLEAMHNEFLKISRYKSPFTNNMFDIANPSIAKALNVYRKLNVRVDDGSLYLAVIAMHVDRIWVYNPSEDAYVEVKYADEGDDFDFFIDTLTSLKDEDTTLIGKQVGSMSYSPTFSIDNVCPHCGEKISRPLNVDSMVFLRAQDSLTEIL